jgi:phosphosulfolactate synthase
MLNFELPYIPERPKKPRTAGITMVIDKGMSIRETEDFLSMGADYTDVVKLGWGTSVITPRLSDKLSVFANHNIPVYFGGTLFEIFYIRGMLNEYCRILEKYKIGSLEVSNGSMDIPLEEKCKVIQTLSRNFEVYSEVGSKDAKKIIAPYLWVEMMQAELNAGATKVIAEARETGTVGMFNSGGEIRSDLIDEIIHHVPPHNILWEAPQKSQQVWFINLLGHNVNLGNIPPQEALPLETLRLGLRGDTFDKFLP